MTKGMLALAVWLALPATATADEVTIADKNGNQLTYSYDSANGPATFKGIKTYATDEAKAGRIVIADAVTDGNGNSHEVKYVSGSVSNRNNLVSIVFGKNIIATGGEDGSKDDAFYNCGRLTSVTLNTKLQILGRYTFQSCNNLESINLNEATNLTTIKYKAFENADHLRQLTIPISVTTIEEGAFSYIDSLRTITFSTGSKLTTLGTGAFRDNPKLESINIETCTQLTNFPNSWLCNCPGITSLTVPASVETFGSNNMFSYTDNIETITFLAPAVPNDFYNGRSNLKTVNIGSGVKSIGNYAFRNSNGLKRLNIDSSVNDLVIGNYAFQNIDALEALTLPKGVVSIGTNAFQSIDSLRTVTFTTGSKLTTMGDGAFRDNTKLERINIEACTSLTNFPSNWLNNCPGITSLTVPASVETFGSNNMFYYTDNIETITFLAPAVPNDFYNGRSNLKTVNIGSGVKSIGNYAFRNSYGLTRLNIDSSVNDLVIGNYAFQNVDAMESLTLPKGVVSIGANAFSHIDSLRTVSFTTGSKLTTMGDGAFRDNTKLERINIEACTSLTNFSSYWLYNCPGIKSLTVPASVETFGSGMFSYTDNIETITFLAPAVPNNFYTGRSNLKTVNIGPGVKSIGNYAFQNSYGMTQLNINSGVSGLSIGNSAFNNCDRIKSITLPVGVVSLDQGAFNNIDSLRTFTFAENSPITEIPRDCFGSNMSLERMKFPDAVTTIGIGVFYNDPSLKEIEFGTGLTTIVDDWGIFYNCPLQKMVLPGVNYPFKRDFNFPADIILYVHPDLVDEYRSNNFTKNYRIMAIGSTTDFAVTTTAGGQLQSKMAEDLAQYAQSLTISGPINGTDIDYLHSSFPNIQVLNLTNARIVAGGDKYHQWEVAQNGNATIYQWNGPWETEDNVVGHYMFYNMPSLQSLSLPKGTTKIGEYAMAQDKHPNLRLASVSIPSSVKEIGRNAFYYTGITQVTVPSGITSIEREVFWHCEKLVNVSLPEGLKTIDHGPFSECYALETVNMPSTVESIGDYAFYNNKVRKSPLVIPATCKSIGNYAFRYNYLLPSITFKEGLQTIGYCAFSQCNVAAVNSLPSTITSIGEWAFEYCEAITQFTVPVSIKDIPTGITYHCDNLTSVTLPTGITTIGSRAFHDCPKLTKVNGLNQTTLTKIFGQAFQNTGLTTVTLPNSITQIDGSVFSYCANLTSINVPTGIDYVPIEFCYNCPSLTKVTMHNGIRTIKRLAFRGCEKLSSIALNDQITTIEYDAFWSCKNLVINKLPSALTYIGGSSFRETPSITASLTIPTGVTEIAGDAFNGSGLSGVVLPESLTTMGNSVFVNCTSLKSAKLPKNITRIPNYTFQHCKSLENIDIPENLREVGYAAFDDSGLTEIELPDSLEKIEGYAFSNTQIQTFRVPDGVSKSSIGAHALENCKHLKKAYMGRNEPGSDITEFTCLHGCDSLELLRVYFGQPPKCNTYYMGYRTNCVLEVPEDQVDLYKAANGWKDFKEIRGFFMGDVLDDLDFAVLCKLYRDDNGKDWKNPWDMSNNHHASGKWQGVVTAKIGGANSLTYAITDIDLSARGLRGELPDSLFMLKHLKTLKLNDNQLSGDIGKMRVNKAIALTEINLCGNQLSGDIYPFASQLPALKKLDVSFNRLTDISKPIDKGISFTYNYQFFDHTTNELVVPNGAPVTNITVGVPFELPTNRLATYRHSNQDYGYSSNDLARFYHQNSYYTPWPNVWEFYKTNGKWNLYEGNSYVLKAAKDEVEAYALGGNHQTILLRLTWTDGDVNADQTIDVTDLQSVIYYALNTAKPNGTMFNYTTADANGDEQINVSDIVGSVEYILGYVRPSGAHARRYNKVSGYSDNLLSVNGTSVTLSHVDAVAALQLTVGGCTARQIRINEALRARFSVSMRDVEDGVRIVIYSPAGNILAAGEHELLMNLPTGAIVSDVELSDLDARHLGIRIVGDATAIDSLSLDKLPLDYLPIYDLMGRRVGSWHTLPTGIYIIHVNGKQYKVSK